GGTVFPWLLRLLLLPTALRILRTTSAGRQAAACERGRGSRFGRGGGTHCRPHSPKVATGSHSVAGRQRLCSRRANGLVRSERRAFCLRVGPEGVGSEQDH